MAGVVERPTVTASLAAIAAVIALTECPACEARAGQGCRGRGGRVMFASTHAARRMRANRQRKANPEAWRTVVAMARELSRAEYVEHMTMQPGNPASGRGWPPPSSI